MRGGIAIQGDRLRGALLAPDRFAKELAAPVLHQSRSGLVKLLKLLFKLGSRLSNWKVVMKLCRSSGFYERLQWLEH
jgi:hypothetical protein